MRTSVYFIYVDFVESSRTDPCDDVVDVALGARDDVDVDFVEKDDDFVDGDVVLDEESKYKNVCRLEPTSSSSSLSALDVVEIKLKK